MLEYCAFQHLQLLESKELSAWLGGTPQPHKLLTLLRTTRLLAYCPTTLSSRGRAIWIPERSDRRLIGRELGLSPQATVRELRQALQAYFDETWPFRSCTYTYQGRRGTITGDLSARVVWQRLACHCPMLVAFTNTQTSELECYPKYSG
jgi:hypothetical protein